MIGVESSAIAALDGGVDRLEVASHPLLVVEPEVEAPEERPAAEPLGSPLRNLRKFDSTQEPLFQDDDAPKEEAVNGLSNSGRHSLLRRSGMRDLLCRLNEATVSPMSRLVKIRRQSSNNKSFSLDDRGVTGQSSPAASESSLGLSPSLANRLSTSLAEAQSKMLSKVSALQRSSGGFARLKTNVSSVINDIKHLKGLDHLGTQVRGTWSASSVRETANLSASEGKLSVNDGLSVKDEWQSHADKFSCNAELPAEDPAFRLSSSMVRLMLNFNSMNDWTIAGERDCGESSKPQVEVILCTASQCPNCEVLCYDSEIMAGWFADDSDLNTCCPFCKHKFVPTLTAVLQPLKGLPRESWYYNRLPEDDDRPSGNKEVCSKSLDSLAGRESPDVDQRVSPSVFDDQLNDLSRCRRRGSRKPNSTDRLSLPLNRRLFHSADGSRNGDRLSSLNSADWRISSSIDANRRRHLFTVPFLNLIVLRKELENMVISDGDASLIDEDFLERRPILFWNLVYVFQRIGAPTHFVSFIGKFYAKKFPSEPSELDACCSDSKENAQQVVLPSVVVRCVHDIPDFHRKDPVKPVYFSLLIDSASLKPSDLLQAFSADQRCVPMAVAKQILDYLEARNLKSPLQLLINDHRKRAELSSPSVSLPTHCSIYRDILFAALWHFGRKLCIEDFESRYEKEFGLLSPKIASLLPAHDHPPSKAAIACRRVFIPLDVI